MIKERKMIILLAEDDPDDVLLTKDALAESNANIELIVVEDGEEALEHLKKCLTEKDKSNPLPHLILLDLNMPRMDGREVLKELKSNELLRKIPVVVLTTSKQEIDIVQCYQLGGNSFITKPVKFENLVEAMRQLDKYWFETVELPS